MSLPLPLQITTYAFYICRFLHLISHFRILGLSRFLEEVRQVPRIIDVVDFQGPREDSYSQVLHSLHFFYGEMSIHGVIVKFFVVKI